MNRLINEIIRNGYLKSDVIIEAFSQISRVEFLPEELISEAYADVSLPIGYGQTISQPSTVALMLELLDPHPGQNILDVGAGSGWTTALLCYIVGKNGRVTSLERKKELKEFGEKNVGKYNFLRSGNGGIAEFKEADGTKGWKENSPYDRILVSASAQKVPQSLKDQLIVGGKMVIPVKDTIWYLEKRGENEFYKEKFPGFSFVPLIED